MIPQFLYFDELVHACWSAYKVKYIQYICKTPVKQVSLMPTTYFFVLFNKKIDWKVFVQL